MTSARANPAATRAVGPGRPKDLEKRAAILDAAKRLFLADGFDGVSMDQIAAAAGVSKLTVYSHFGDKDTLFRAAVQATCEALMPPQLFLIDLHGPIRRQLTEIARAFHALITSDESIAVHRMMSAQTRDSRLPKLFWEAGPMRVQTAFAGFLQSEIDAGQLRIDDLQRATSQFFCLLKGELHARLLCGCPDQLGAAELEAHLAATVDLFLKAYGAPPTGAGQR